MKNLILLLLALALGAVLIPVGIVFTVIQAIRQWSWRKIVGYLDKSAGALALAIDHFGNTVCRDLFNAIFVKGNCHDFGDIRETISSVLGRNYRYGTLTRTGRVLVAILDAIDPGHVIKAIKD